MGLDISPFGLLQLHTVTGGYPMPLQIVTSEAADFYNFGPGTSWVTITASSIVSAGVQTNNNQQDFSIAQLYYYGGGQNVYIQVANTKFAGSIGWKWVVVRAFDSGDAAEQLPEVKAEFGSAPKTT
jgi:hypothetical protein